MILENHTEDKDVYREVVGLLPAAGQATRIAPLPCSKELYPIGFRTSAEDGGLRPKVACHYLLESMRLAGITKAFVVLRKGKWDIPAYLGDGSMLDMHLAYLMMGLPFGAPYTLDQAYAFVQHALVAFGFPDIITKPDDAFVRLLERQAETNADVVLGLFVPDQPHKWDMVDLDDEGRIRRIVIKPTQTQLRYAWCIAVWTPAFTHFMHAYLEDLQKPGDRADGDHPGPDRRELYVGDVIQAAMRRDMRIEAVRFSDGVCLDIGTPDALVQAVRDYTP